MTTNIGPTAKTPSLIHIKGTARHLSQNLLTIQRFSSTLTDRDGDIIMLAFLFLLGLALCAGSPAEEEAVEPWLNSCPMSWSFYNGRSYMYVSTHRTWAEAELHCVSLGANLVSIHSKEEHWLVRSLIKNVDPAEAWTWIGLNDVHKEGRWMWSDGCAAKFFYWHIREPSNGGGNEDCGHTNFGGKWNDRPCSSTYPSVCASRITCN